MVLLLSFALAECLTESVAAAFMKCSPTVPSALIWYGEHSGDGFQMIRELAMLS
jgi:hypothetical protein